MPAAKISLWMDSSYVIVHHFPWCTQVMMRLFSPRKTTLLFVIRDQTKVWIYVVELLLRWLKYFWLLNVSSVIWWLFALFVIVYSDSTWVSGACSKGRYSEGILCICTVYGLFSSGKLFVFCNIFLRLYLLQIWDDVAKPEAQKSSPLSDFFYVCRILSFAYFSQMS